MSVEDDVSALVAAAGEELSIEGVHDLLLRIADTIGAPPRAITGPGPELIWQVGERGVTVVVTNFRNKLSVWAEEFDWQETDDERYRAFKYAMSIDELPYLWSVPVAGGSVWGPGNPVVTNWADFFFCFDTCMNKLPGQLQLIPPAWLPRGPVVSSLWNIDGTEFASMAISISAAGVELNAHRSEGTEVDIQVPADRLGPEDVNVPAVLAGLTATGEYRELMFFENEIAVEGVYPCGVEDGDPDYRPEDLGPGEKPPVTQSLDEVRALLARTAVEPSEPAAPKSTAPEPAAPESASAFVPPAEPANPAPPAAPVPPAPAPVAAPPVEPVQAAKPDRKPFWRRGPKQRVAPYVATLPVAHSMELATQLAMNNHDSLAVLAAWGVQLDDHGRGSLQLGLVRCAPETGGHKVMVEFMPEGREINDPKGAAAYGRELTAGLSARFGAPGAIAGIDSGGSRAWKIGAAGLAVETTPDRVAILVVSDGDWLLSVVRDADYGAPS